MTFGDEKNIIVYEKGNLTVYDFELGKDLLWFDYKATNKITSATYNDDSFSFIINDGEYLLTFYTMAQESINIPEINII